VIDRRVTDFVSGVCQHFGSGLGIVSAHVGQDDVLTNANAARDRLADLTGSDENNYIFHSRALV